MTHYSELNSIERAIVDDLTKGWYLGGGEASTDALNTFYFAKDSVDACDGYSSTPSVNVEHMKQAIVNRFNFTQQEGK